MTPDPRPLIEVLAEEPELQVFSYGGGVQSTACLVLAAEGKIDFGTFLFANTGDDSELPATLDYVRKTAMPFAADNALCITELHRVKRTGEQETLWERTMRPDRWSPQIPVYLTGGRPVPRKCTHDFKIAVIEKELRRLGATVDVPATVGLGISTDELQRAHPGVDPRSPYQNRVYPLLDLGISRTECHRIIKSAGLEVPQKSACFFCPFHALEDWRRLKRQTPDLFAKACEMESALNERRERLGKEPVWLTRFGQPLERLFDDQMVFDLGGDCESGYCMT